MQQLIILCPVRSSSSLLSAMLGQHPDVCALPELNLFLADSVAEFQRMHADLPEGRHGVLRALAHTHDGTQSAEAVDAAQRWLDTHGDWSVRQVLDHLAESAGKRVVVECSPRIAAQPAALERARTLYPEASYLHLVRHPRSLAKILRAASLKDTDLIDGERGGDPEQIWLQAHRNIADFTTGLALGQCMRVKQESLLAEPRLYLAQIAEWLDIDTASEAVDSMLHPEEWTFAKPGPGNARYGADPDFLRDPGLHEASADEPALEGALEWDAARTFSAPALKLARELGYA